MKSNVNFLIVFQILFFVLIGCNGQKEEKKEKIHIKNNKIVKLNAESLKEIKLVTEILQKKLFTGYLIIPATVIINQDNEAQIGSLVQGRVHKVFAKAGDFVKAGQVLMTIEGLNIGEIKSGYIKSKANFDYAKANYERQKKLFDEKIGSQKALLESQAEFEKANAEFRAEDKKIHSVGLNDEDVADGTGNLEHTSGTLPIKSPINGIVVERNVVIGQYIDATTNAFKVININSVWIDGQIYEKDIEKINKITNIEFTTTAYQNEIFDGKIIYIGQTVDEKSRTVTVRGEFSNKNNKLKPQMFGEIKIPLGSDAMAIMIPGESVVKESGEEYVFIQVNVSTFEKRNVITGSTVNDMIEIKEGLSESEKIVTKGVFYLKSELKKEELEGDEH